MNKMHKIYYSVRDALDRISGVSKVRSDTGWGRLVDTMEAALLDYGFILTDADNADVEFYVGQPPINILPEMRPCIQLTMYETSQLPLGWSAILNNWDEVIVPSTWGKQTFIESGVEVPIYVVPLPIDIDRFKFADRTVDDWTYIAQSVQLKDRKNIGLVFEIFEKNKMPNDAKLILKTIPMHSHFEADLPLHPQVQFKQLSLSFEEYYKLLSSCHVSVNPSSGEGFGYIPCLIPETIVYIDNSIKRIDNVCIGDLALTHKGNWKRVTNISIKECNEEILEIKVAGSYKPIRLTSNHIVPVYRPYKKQRLFSQFNPQQMLLFHANIEWIKASDITTVDLMLQPRLVSNTSNSQLYIDLAKYVTDTLYDDESIWYKMSYSINSEWSYKRLVEVTNFPYRSLQRVIQNTEGISGEYRKRIQSKLDEIGYIKPEPIKYQRYWKLDEELAYILGIYTAEGSYSGGVVEFSIHKDEEDFAVAIKKCFAKYINGNPIDVVTPGTKSRRIIYASTLIGKFFSNCCGLGAHNKKIPDFIMNGYVGLKKEFLRGLFEGDANNNNRKYNTGKCTVLCTVSKTLAYQVKLLLLKIGMNAQITKGETRGFYAYYVGVGGKQLGGSDFLNEEWSDEFSRQRFFTDIDYYYYHIESITKKHYAGAVYDLTIEDDNTFCVNGGYVVHNCEAMSTGMCTLMTDYSALTDLLNNSFTIPIQCTVSPTHFFMSGGLDAKPDKQSILDGMLWTYNNRETALEYGRLSSEWVANKFSPYNICTQLESVFASAVKNYPKKMEYYDLNCKRFDNLYPLFKV